MFAHPKASRLPSPTMTNSEECFLGVHAEEGPCCSPTSFEHEDDKEATQMTCDVLCSLSSSAATSQPHASASVKSEDSCEFSHDSSKRRNSKTCASKQFQLPMFLSSKFSYRFVSNRFFCICCPGAARLFRTCTEHLKNSPPIDRIS
jgi:hypothetical protein